MRWRRKVVEKAEEYEEPLVECLDCRGMFSKYRLRDGLCDNDRKKREDLLRHTERVAFDSFKQEFQSKIPRGWALIHQDDLQYLMTGTKQLDSEGKQIARLGAFDNQIPIVKSTQI